MTGNLPTHSRASGKRVWRVDMYSFADWAPDEDEVQRGPRTEFEEGIYVVTVHKGTPTDWLGIAMKATIASTGQRPGPDLLPGHNYDSFRAVLGGRIVGGALVALESAPRYLWTIHLKPDGEAHTLDELFGDSGEGCCCLRFDRNLGWAPAIYTIWVHKEHRRKGIGGQLVQSIANYNDLPQEKLCFRPPLSKEAVRMTRALGLTQIIACL